MVWDACSASISERSWTRLVPVAARPIGRTYQIVATGKFGGQLELVGHILRLHDLVGPLSVGIVELVDLEPRANAGCLLGIGDRSVEEVGDGPRVRRRVPLDLDGVACFGRTYGNRRRHDVAVHVAGDVVRLHVRHRVVRRRHADACLVPWRHSVDPKLVEVLMGEGADGEEEKGKHG